MIWIMVWTKCKTLANEISVPVISSQWNWAWEKIDVNLFSLIWPKKHFQYYFGQTMSHDWLFLFSSTKLGQAIVIQDLRGVYSKQTRRFGKEAQILQYVFKQWLLIFAIISNYSFLLAFKFVDKIYCYNWTSKSTVKVNVKRMKDLLFCVYAVPRTLNLKMSRQRNYFVVLKLY